jgi:ABC-type Fe3+/spermidine/putrescine transport system ATPase subunit
MRFGDFTAIKNLNLKVKDGEYVTLLGPSGCGKTTLIKMIAGILRPTEGKVFIGGQDHTDTLIEDRDIGYVFQNIALFPHMTNGQNVGYSSRVKGESKEKREENTGKYLELVKMLARAGMMPGELSGGEQQKVAIARALASGSKTMLLDEPLSALDARVRVELRYDILRLVKKLGITVVHVTHDQEEAMSVSDRIILMRKGGIVETGTPMEIYRNPKSIFAANFIGETNLMECTVAGKTKKGRTIVRLRSGDKVRARKSSLSTGDAAVLSVRPEYVYTASEGLAAKVESTVFMGTYRRVRAKAVTGDRVEYNISADDPLPKAGDRVNLVFNKKAATVFPKPYDGLTEAIRLE